MKMYLGREVDEGQLYRFQIPYNENEIFVAVQSIVAYLTSRTPSAEVYPAQDSQMSRILATDIEKAIEAHSDKFQLNMELASVVRHLMLKRVGVLHLWFDPDYGEYGEIRVKSINPDHLIFDKNAEQGQNPAFIAHIHKDSVEELVYRHPEKKEDIYSALGYKLKNPTPKQMSQTVIWRQVWVTHYKNNEPIEGCVSYFDNVVLSKYKDPNWIYNGKGGALKNFLDMPTKPYILFNDINDGQHLIDHTTVIEQAGWIQEVLNKRGRQIMENADTANGFRIFDSKALTMDQAQNLTGDPNQKILLKNSTGGPLSNLVMNIAPTMLPDYVVQDKTDLRNTLHTITGTPSQFRGDNNDENDTTLGESLMVKNQASGRQDLTVRSIAASMNRYFKFLTQMMKVHYTEKHFYTVNGGDGEFDHIAMHRDKIEDGVSINVKEGSSLPFDKSRQEAIALQLAKMDRISTLDLYKDLHIESPQKRYDNWQKEKANPQELARSANDELADVKAYEDYMDIMEGNKTVPPTPNADKEHILTHRKQMLTDEFLNAKIPKQRAFVKHLTEELKSLELRTTLDIMAQQEGIKALEPNVPIVAPPPPPPPMMPPMGSMGMPAPGGMGAPPPMAPPMGAPAPGMPPGAPMPAPMGAPPPTLGSVMGGTGLPNPANPTMPNPGNPSSLPPI